MFAEGYILKRWLDLNVKILMGRSCEEGLMAERDDPEFPKKAGVSAPRKM